MGRAAGTKIPVESGGGSNQVDGQTSKGLKWAVAARLGNAEPRVLRCGAQVRLD